ncbi:MAG: 2-oxoglutarate dehydrogenase, E2 component, dihydrolipoamide succinyltransferase [Propionibacteriaceae bacterium]|nr:2-oxoglutarate dehydrogenase, E2 component, dihydrolipoamide succinyltransferase [Propionibacteriaceae bacterium]
MSTSVTLPALGESVTEGTVTRWLKQIGDTVEVDEPLLEVSTDKVDTEIPSPAAGVLLEISAQEDETVEVGAVLGVIGDESETGGDDAGRGSVAADPEPEPAAEETAPEPEHPEPEAEQVDEPETATAAPSPSSGGGGTEVALPALGESVTEGTVSRWLKQVGDSVEADEALLEVSTDKVDTEIPSPISGVLLEIRVAEDETVEVGAVLAVVGEEGASTPDEQPRPQPQRQPEPEPEPQAKEEPAGQPEPEPAPEPPAAPEPQASPEPQLERPAARAPQRQDPQPEDHGPSARGSQARTSTPVANDSDAGYVTPLVRKLAAEHEVDLGALNGTGVGGRIRKQDVLAAAEAAKAEREAAASAPAPQAAPAVAAATTAEGTEVSSLRGTTEKMSRLRKTIAKRMVESLQVSAQLTTVVEVDMTVISRLRASVKDDFAAREGVKLSYLPFLLKATVEALKVHPKVNATIDTEAGEISYPATENIAIAVDTEKGLLVPVIKDAGDLSIAGLAKKVVDLASRTRSNKLSPDDLAGGTFTVTNTGSRGALFDTPIINQPQVAILGTGALVRRAVVLNDKVLGETLGIRDMMYLALSYDHRLVDGADAARFLTTLKARLEEGDFGSEFGL